MIETLAMSKPSQTTSPNHTLWWRRIFDDSEDAQLVCRGDGTLVEINHKAAQLFEVAKSGVEGVANPLLQSLTKNTADKLRLLIGGREGRTELINAVSIRLEESVPLLADLVVVSLHDNYWLITIKDASRRWRMETHAQRLITAINSTPDVVFLTDSEFRFTFVNSSFHTATGYTFEEVLGQPIYLLYAAEDQKLIEGHLGPVSEGQDWLGEVQSLRRDGALWPAEVAVSPIYDQQGTFIGCVAIQRDLTAKKILQAELVSERNLVMSIMNSLDSAVYTLDRNFKLTHYNEAWKKIPAEHGWLTLDTPPIHGKNILDFVKDATRREKLREVFEKVLEQESAEEVRTTVDGRQWHMNVGLWRSDDQTKGLIYMVTDHTQFTELQNQLYQAQKMETIGALAAGVAHDFNNLLLAIRGNASLLMLDKDLSSEPMDRLKQIDNAARRGAEITRQLLSFSRASDEKIDILDFNLVIKEASQLAKRSLRGGKFCIALAPAKDPIKVQMDATRAQQLVLNLCINAIDAMPEGGTLTLSNELIRLDATQASKAKSTEGAAFLCCLIKDTGTGISPKVMERIFDPFFTTKEKDKGTGIGLAVVQNIVNKAGGFLEVETAVEEGTTFRIFIPSVQGVVTVEDTGAKRDLSAGTGTVLVVDDLDLVLDFTSNFLKAAGYKVYTAIDADAALEVLEKEDGQIDLLLTDYNMPGKNGWQLLEEVARRWPPIKLILASGFLEDHERTQIEEDFGAHVLAKPYNISEATDLIAEILGKKTVS